jgi:hypothetical protein
MNFKLFIIYISLLLGFIECDFLVRVDTGVRVGVEIGVGILE